MQPDPIADLICSGRTISETAEALGQSALAVYQHCELVGLVSVARAVYAGRDVSIAAMAEKRGTPWSKRPHGERNAEIIAAVLDGERQRVVAERFGVSQNRVSAIVTAHRRNVDNSGLFGDNSDSSQVT